VYVLGAAAWIELAVAHGPWSSFGHDHAKTATAGIALLLVMAGAMMFPFIAPAVRHVARTAFWKRRQQAAVCFVLGFSIVWALLAVALGAVLAASGGLAPSVLWVCAAAAGAALWQGSRLRRRAAARCGGRPALPQRGWRAARRAVEAGGAFGLRCVPVCGPAMAVMAVSPQLPVMAAVFAIQTYEWRRAPNPFTDRRCHVPGAAYIVIAALVALQAAL
jgi:hypothetical protein